MMHNDDTIKQPDEMSDKEEEILDEVEDVIEEISEEDEVNVWEEKYKRALADYQNLEKRVAEQRRELILSASRELLNRLLPVLDTLLLAEKHVQDKGLAVSIAQFTDVLKAEGVTRIEAKGKKFDPSIMEAVGTQNGDEGIVMEEARAGYLLHEKLLRPAQVIVGQKGEKN